ncbi:hypothetical protein SDC9_210056 [bioreactor metagenome]|uniref:Uncharacterized protein n=1 Tax=bioreactor metagenome TaxID=1076179 RepID=A0A645JHY0_9ZZZZ
MVEQFVQTGDAGGRVAKGLEAHFQAERLLQPLDDGFGRHPVGDQRQAVDLDDRQVGEGKRRGQPEGHRLGEWQPMVAQHRRHDAAFAVGGLAVLEFHQSIFFNCSTLSPMASA